MSMEPQIKYALTEDGVSIGYWSIGEGTPFIWPHGALGSSSLRAWRIPEGRAFIERIAAHRRLVRYDARGFGISQAGVIDLSLEARVRDLAAVVDRLDVQRPTGRWLCSNDGAAQMEASATVPSGPQPSTCC